MELERTQIQKTLFGNYKPAEVDSLLDRAEELLRQRESETAEETARADAQTQECERLAQQLAEQEQQLAALRESVKLLSEENDRQEELTQTLCEACQRREEESRSLRDELADVRTQLEDARSELELAKSQTTVLGNRVARQRRELEEKDQLLLADPVGEANKRAEQIVQNATQMSKQMLDDAESMRARALAAVRAAYFNTMGFRQSVEERFFSLQNDLNQSLLTLRALEAENEPSDKDVIQEKP